MERWKQTPSFPVEHPVISSRDQNAQGLVFVFETKPKIAWLFGKKTNLKAVRKPG